MSDGIQRRVVCAAVRSPEGLVVCGPRHLDPSMRLVLMRLGVFAKDIGGWEQGFVDQRGEFMSREEALRVAWNAGQVIRRCGGDDRQLFSENLY